MDKLLYKRINLLIHLANVDGKFHASEKELLKSLLRENGLEASYLEEHRSVPISFESFRAMPEKGELLFWVLKLIHADGELHPFEVTFAKTIASELGFKAEVIDHYQNRPVQSLAEFEKEINAFQI